MIYVSEDFLRISKQDYLKCISLLSEQRLEKMRQYQFETDRKACMGSYLLLRYGLMQEYGFLQKPELQIGDGEGKPKLRQARGVFFNLSHCCDAVACAIDRNEVGLDVQSIEEYSDTLGENTMTCFEREQITCAASPDRRFTQLWTLKEAFGKYKGEGILYDLSATDFSAFHLGWTSSNGLEFYLNLETKYAIAFCGERRLEIRHVSAKQIIDCFARREIKDTEVYTDGGNKVRP